jgi:fermentation-respiration switch protein FrsA (DUF1100 family)
VKLLAFVFASYALVLVALTVFQRRLQYFPDPNIIPPAAAAMTGVEELRLEAEDGEILVAWHIPAPEGRPLILYFHGNGGSLIDRAIRFKSLAESGYGVLAVSYRGYGGSSGSPSEAGLMRDGEALYRAARARGYADRRIVMMGESLGTSLAVFLARAHEPAAVVLDSAYLSAVDVAAAHYWMFPARWLLKDRYRADLAIGDVHAPVLFVHGESDFIVPLESAKKLFERANEPKTFIVVPRAGHLVLDLPDVFPRVREWIDATVSRGAPPRRGIFILPAGKS